MTDKIMRLLRRTWVVSLRRRVRVILKHVYEVAVDELHEVQPNLPVQFRVGTRADLGRLCHNLDYEPTDQIFLSERLACGDWLVVAESGGQFAFAAWIMFGRMEIGESLVRLPADCAYCYKVYTAEPFRRRGIVLAYYGFIKKKLHDRGVGRLLCSVIHGNVPSIRVHQRAGFKPIGSFCELRVSPRAMYLIWGPLRACIGTFVYGRV